MTLDPATGLAAISRLRWADFGAFAFVNGLINACAESSHVCERQHSRETVNQLRKGAALNAVQIAEVLVGARQPAG
ncbi:MAG TPA: hypothetical protein VI485_25735 [Vicinamibacterales bacterium]|nr:hypothetical protein [Vicinamibacterales bacterium]